MYRGLEGVSASVDGNRLAIRGKLAGLDIEHVFELPADRPIMEERIVLHNTTNSRIELSDFEAGLIRTLTDEAGQVLPELANDRFVAVPFRAKVFLDADDYARWELVDHDATAQQVATMVKQGMSVRQIATALKRSKNGVQKAIKRAKARGMLPLQPVQ